jgi:hypothetical protein
VVHSVFDLGHFGVWCVSYGMIVAVVRISLYESFGCKSGESGGGVGVKSGSWKVLVRVPIEPLWLCVGGFGVPRGDVEGRSWRSVHRFWELES